MRHLFCKAKYLYSGDIDGYSTAIAALPFTLLQNKCPGALAITILTSRREIQILKFRGLNGRFATKIKVNMSQSDHAVNYLVKFTIFS